MHTRSDCTIFAFFAGDRKNQQQFVTGCHRQPSKTVIVTAIFEQQNEFILHRFEILTLFPFLVFSFCGMNEVKIPESLFLQQAIIMALQRLQMSFTQIGQKGNVESVEMRSKTSVATKRKCIGCRR